MRSLVATRQLQFAASILLVGVLQTGLLTGVASAENWPQWRGVHNDGISPEKGVPVKWSATDNIAWKLPMPGPAGSTPAVWGGQIFVTTANGDNLELLAISTAGKELWRAQLGGGNKTARGDEGNMASASPSTDGKHVWAFVGNGTLACFTVEGVEVWRINVQDKYGKFDIQFGMSSTPVLDQGRLYLQLIHGDGNPKTREAFTVCLDGATGNEVWKQPRPSPAHSENEHSYASPVLYRDGTRAFLLTHGADYIVAHDLADGHELWRSGGIQHKSYNSALRLVSSPVAVPGLIVVPSAKNGPVLGLAPTGQGDITDSKTERLWTRDSNTPDVSSPLVYEGLVYLCRENGNLICLDAKTGKEHYEKPTTRDRHRASPMAADGKIYLSARNGNVTVVKAGPEFEVLSVNKLEETISASPAVSNGRIYIRTFESLWAIGTSSTASR